MHSATWSVLSLHTPVILLHEVYDVAGFDVSLILSITHIEMISDGWIKYNSSEVVAVGAQQANMDSASRP